MVFTVGEVLAMVMATDTAIHIMATVMDIGEDGEDQDFALDFVWVKDNRNPVNVNKWDMIWNCQIYCALKLNSIIKKAFIISIFFYFKCIISWF